MEFNRLYINANDKIIPVADVFWLITLMAHCTVGGLKSNLQKQLPKAELSPEGSVGWTKIQPTHKQITFNAISINRVRPNVGNACELRC